MDITDITAIEITLMISEISYLPTNPGDVIWERHLQFMPEVIRTLFPGGSPSNGAVNDVLNNIRVCSKFT